MNIFLTSIQSIIPIITIIVLGYILQVRGWFGEDFGPNLSRLIMNVALPVSIFVFGSFCHWIHFCFCCR